MADITLPLTQLPRAVGSIGQCAAGHSVALQGMAGVGSIGRLWEQFVHDPLYQVSLPYARMEVWFSSTKGDAMTCLSTFPPIDPEATRVLTFHCANGLNPGDVLSAPVRVEVTTDGDDPLPIARFSSPQVVGSDVLITASECYQGNTYHIRVIVPTSDAQNTLVVVGDLPCQLA